MAPDLGKIGSGESGAFLLTPICLECRGCHHDDPPQLEHLELQATIRWDDHELHVARSPQHSVERAVEVHYFKVEELHTEVGRAPKGNGEPYASERSPSCSRDNPEEGSPARAKLLS